MTNSPGIKWHPFNFEYTLPRERSAPLPPNFQNIPRGDREEVILMSDEPEWLPPLSGDDEQSSPAEDAPQPEPESEPEPEPIVIETGPNGDIIA